MSILSGLTRSKIIEVEDFPEARKPSYKLKIDFGKDFEIKKSCAKHPENYNKDELQGLLVLGVVNFPARQIEPTISDVLTLGVPDERGNCNLISTTKEAFVVGSLY